ncbi:2-oxoglutarate dehydrogenase E1 component [Fredinandcohnia sp. 179-A 10B2 NHS]|uniref:2-oxoglutarate dehydrogenase E1 component n=1 Tax=Fredinandcohnia sp. 179-A 10B2 NHS TaxID=3235176 RepID=UPI0039A0C446
MNSQQMKNVWETFYGPNMGYVFDMYDKYKEDPSLVDPSVRALFEELGPPPTDEKVTESTSQVASPDMFKKVIAANKLLKNVRAYGHLAANIYPLRTRPKPDTSYLEIDAYNLTKEDLQSIPASCIWEEAPARIETAWDAYQYLRSIYTQTIAYEFGHIHDEQERKWLTQQVELNGVNLNLSNSQKKELLERLIQVDGFEKFLHKTFVGQKRFSIEGLDMLVPMLEKLIQEGCEDGTDNIMIGMAHRGRLNVLAHVLHKPYELIFSEFHHSPNKELVPSEGSRGINYGWSGDVKYHLGADRKVKGSTTEHTTHINLANNPSHLEFVNPVVQGITRAAQDTTDKAGYPEQNKQKAFSVLIHGDAAFPGEGVVAETLNLSRLKGYETGGTVHIIANNLVGFTTNNTDSRSTRFASDLAKGYEIPIIRVNADDPEACLAAIAFAYQYRKQFQKDILIDLVGYRRFGHNEMDDPNVTQPHLYKMIAEHPVIADKYGKTLVTNSTLTEAELAQKKDEFMQSLQETYNSFVDNEELKKQQVPKVLSDIPEFDTSVPVEILRSINKGLLNWPETLTVYPKLERILKRRESALEEGNKVDWALAETLAFATVLSEGTTVRLTGQDSERGTFAHRHVAINDYETNEKYIPLHHIPEAKAPFSIYNSPLSETAVLGFEYGYTVQNPKALVLWEAQFGDFVNVAQPIIDQFISAGRAKWGQKSSLVMLLPHGYEGQGPEHSSGRLERFINAAAENNWIVANVTSAAQYFHLLRRQALLSETDESRPLIVMTPKSLLRHPQTGSPVSELTNGAFKPLVEQPGLGSETEKVTRLVLCSGKVAIDLATEVAELPSEKTESIHIARVEQLYPFPKKEVQELVDRYPNLEEIIWVQEEPKNMGAWPAIQSVLIEHFAKEIKIDYIGRPKRSSPATGDPDIHKQEQAWIIEDSLRISKGGDQL